MKTNFFDFQLSKSEMNNLRGGETTTYTCRCNTSGGSIYFDVSAESDEILKAKMEAECDGKAYFCQIALD